MLCGKGAVLVNSFVIKNNCFVGVCSQAGDTSIEDTMKPPPNSASAESTVQTTDLQNVR